MLLFPFILLILSISCNQDDSLNLPLQDQGLQNYTDQFGKQEFDYNFYPNLNNYEEFENSIRRRTNTDIEKIAYILVFSASREISQLSFEKAQSISLIGYKNNILVQRYYFQNNATWENKIELNQPLNHLYTLTFNLLTQYSFESHNNQNIFTTILQNPENLLATDNRYNGRSERENNTTYKVINLESVLLKKIKDKNAIRFYFSKMENDFNIYSINSNDLFQRQACTSSCNSGSGSLCQPSAGTCGNSATYEGGCKISPIENQINIESLTQNTFAFNQTEFYSIRDEVLSNTDLGKEYINDYYTICQFIHAEDLSLSTLGRIVSVTPKLYTAYNNYKTNNGVIISSQLKNELKSIMLDIKSLDSGNNYSSIIDNLVSDLEINANKNKAQIDAFLAN